ncbi:MAG TPA: glycoside hydrolase family 30 beta sandwich domain-containing protein [Balneolales bacterium]|nr:glycoside hydrolase family 30 beta sandwich domain-containing protein [Balneolales bacterium]
MKTIFKGLFLSLMLMFMVMDFSCSKQPTSAIDGTGTNPPKDTTTTPTSPAETDVSLWLTKADKSALFQKQNVSLIFSNTSGSGPTITVDTTLTYQSVAGFGFALTGGSAYLIYRLPSDQRSELLHDLFATDSTSIGVSYLRLSIGASDLNQNVFSYDDMPAGQTDTTLASFDLGPDKYNVVPLLKEIIAIDPNIKTIATPWSAPVWMKTNSSSVGGSLNPKYYAVYAKYFVKYIQEMEANGIHITAITPQNEPLYGGNNPSMVMQASEEATFVKDYLGPAFEAAGLDTKIVVYDHNCDRPDYPMDILADTSAYKYVDGSAFHLYGGAITALSQVHNAYPDKNVYFTEQWTGGPGDFKSDIDWHVKNLIIGATRNWSKNVLEWNLASDPNYEPHTPGGCSTCMGALTIGASIAKNVSYYIVASASKFVRPGSMRIASNIPGSLQNVAFQAPDGKKILIVLNDGTASQTFNIDFAGKRVNTSLDAGSVGTYVWK